MFGREGGCTGLILTHSAAIWGFSLTLFLAVAMAPYVAEFLLGNIWAGAVASCRVGYGVPVHVVGDDSTTHLVRRSGGA